MANESDEDEEMKIVKRSPEEYLNTISTKKSSKFIIKAGITCVRIRK